MYLSNDSWLKVEHIEGFNFTTHHISSFNRDSKLISDTTIDGLFIARSMAQKEHKFNMEFFLWSISKVLQWSAGVHKGLWKFDGHVMSRSCGPWFIQQVAAQKCSFPLSGIHHGDVQTTRPRGVLDQVSPHLLLYSD